jgi:conjugative relaxase-like TrwC/TraI family protein
MLKIRPITNIPARVAYHTGGAALTTAEKLAFFLGQGAERAGFPMQRHAITADALASALNGYAPSGAYLGLRRSSKRRPGWDVVLSPHKSISIAALCLDSNLGETVRACWEKAVRATVACMEGLAAHSQNWRGAVASGNLCIVAFTHERSRRNDPQLHTHLLVLNVTHSERFGGWRGLEPAPIYRSNMDLDKVLNHELARELDAAGLLIARDNKGRVYLPGVDQATVRRFSKAKQVIDQAEAAMRTGNTEESKTAGLNSIGQREMLRDLLNDRLRPSKRKAARPLTEALPPTQRRSLSRACRRPSRPSPPGHPKIKATASEPPLNPLDLNVQFADILRRRTLWPKPKACLRALVELAKSIPTVTVVTLAQKIAWSKWGHRKPVVSPNEEQSERIGRARRHKVRILRTLMTAVVRQKIKGHRKKNQPQPVTLSLRRRRSLDARRRSLSSIRLRRP